MQCDLCSKTLLPWSGISDKANTVFCEECYGTEAANALITDTDREATTATQFRALLTFGKLISGLGWVVVILGAMGIWVGFSELGGTVQGLIGLAAGLLLAIVGVLMAVLGQQISCFVAIEKNTRRVYEILETRAL